MYVRVGYPKFKAWDENDNPAIGYEVHTYEAGTTTPINTYSERTLNIANTNPVILDAYGEADIYVGTATKLVFTEPGGDPSDPIWTVDYIGEQVDIFLRGEATPGTVNNNYVVDIIPALMSLSNNLMVVFTPDVDNIDTIASQNFTGTGINDGVFTGPYVGSSPGSVFTVQIDSAAVLGTTVFSGVLGTLVFSGAGLDDATFGGTPTTAGSTYVVEIDGTGSPNTFKWQVDGNAWTTGVAITQAAQTLQDGVTVTFAAKTGHTSGNSWTVESTGLDDATFGGTPTEASHTFVVTIDATGSPDTFKWHVDGGSWTAGVEITGAAQDLQYGVTVTFAATTGHSVGGSWAMPTDQVNPNTFQWKKDGGAWNTGIAITALKQSLIEGVSITFAEIVGHTLNDIWALTVMTPARLNLCSLGNLIIYKNVGGSLQALDGSDLKQDIPAIVVYSQTQNCYILANPQAPVLRTLIPDRVRKELTADYNVNINDKGTELSCDGTFTVYLPPCPSVSGTFYYIKNKGSGVITVDAGIYNIHGPYSVTPSHTFDLIIGVIDTIQLVTNGVDWHIVTITAPSIGDRVVITSDQDWTVPPGLLNKPVNIIAVGAGGGGGGKGAGGVSSGGGGGGAIDHIVGVFTPGEVISVVIGSGGAGGSGNEDGVDGEDTTFGSYLSAAGGKGGPRSTSGSDLRVALGGKITGLNLLRSSNADGFPNGWYLASDGVTWLGDAAGGDSGFHLGIGGADPGSEEGVPGTGYGAGGSGTAHGAGVGGDGTDGAVIIWW